MRSITLMAIFLCSTSAAEGSGPDGGVLSYDFRDARALRALEVAANQLTAELYVEPALIDTLADLRVTMKGFEPTRRWMHLFCDELARLATKHEQAALEAGESIRIPYEIIEQDGRRIVLVRREVKKP